MIFSRLDPAVLYVSKLLTRLNHCKLLPLEHRLSNSWNTLTQSERTELELRGITKGWMLTHLIKQRPGSILFIPPPNSGLSLLREYLRKLASKIFSGRS